MSRLIGILLLLGVACSNKEVIDSNPGIQDVILGMDITNFNDRIQDQDSMVTTKQAMIYVIKLNTPIAENCMGWNSSAVRVYTFRSRIMMIEINSIYCDRLNDIFINKFGQPNLTTRNGHVWRGKNCELTFKDTGDHYDSYPAYEILFIEKDIYSDYQKSAQGNI